MTRRIARLALSALLYAACVPGSTTTVGFTTGVEGAPPPPPHLLHLLRAAPRESCVTVVKGPVQARVGELLEPGEVPAGTLSFLMPM